MAQVLLSYARQERDRAAWLADHLGDAGWDVWWDEQLVAGSTFDEEIDRRLHLADAVIVLWSRASVVSRWVKAEADVASERGVLVPVRLDDVEIPLPFRTMHAADLLDWRGQTDHPGLAQIHSALERLSAADLPHSRQPRVPRPSDGGARAVSRRLWRNRRVWLGLVALVAAITIGALTLAGQWSNREAIVVPNVIGMRFDEAALELNRQGIGGFGWRQVTGEPFPEDLRTWKRPPGSRTSHRLPAVSCPAGNPT